MIGSLGICVWVASQAQYRTVSVENERKARIEEVRKKRKMLTEIKTRRQVSLNELSFLKMQIATQMQLIRTLEVEIDTLQHQLAALGSSIVALENKLDLLKNEYAKMIYATARNNYAIHKLSFIFASESFYQFYRRTQYLKQYSQARQTRVDEIQLTQQALKKQQILTQQLTQEKLALLSEKRPEIQTLEKLKKEKDQLLKALSRQESKLKQELKQSQNKLNNLNKMVGDLVKEQNIEANNRPTRPRQTKLKAPAKALTKEFTAQKGRLTFPVAKGFVAAAFGKQEHPILKDVMIDNAGIEIQTPKNQAVRAIHDGEVSTIATIPGMGGQVVMIQHGEYFSVYAKIQKIKVKIGDWVSEGDSFAQVHEDNQGSSILQFQIWKGNQKLNPTKWVRKP